MAIDEEKLKKYIKMGCESKDGESVFKQRVFSGLLEALGWPDEQIVYERSISVGRSSPIRADFELIINEAKCIIEIKAPGVDISRHYDQLISYMKQEEAKLGFIYNGKKLSLFVRNSEPDWSHNPAYEWECGQEDNEVFYYLSPEKISRIVEDFLTERKNGRLLDMALSDKISHIKNAVVDILSNETGLNQDYIRNNVDVIVRTPRIQRQAEDNVNNEVVSNNDLPGDDNDVVVVCPASGEQDEDKGENWMLRYNAWRSINMVRTDAKYMALYQGFPHSKIRWFAQIDKILDIGDPILGSDYHIPAPKDSTERKKALILKEGTIKMLRTPIDKASWGGLRNIMYTTIGKLKRANTLDDL
jgi:hypothetical protein